MNIPKLKGRLIFGGDYNPEQWPEHVWQEDMQLMRRAGVNMVSLGIFAWAKLQPGPDQWDFAWLDRIMDLLAENEICACLATATASPPAWLVHAHPEVLPVTAEGVTLYPGSRQHYSPSSSAYRDAAARLVDRLAIQYKAHPALAAWHVNNEYACHMPECHNEESTLAFRDWLKRRYGSIEELNTAWGTAFWSQVYSSWDQVFTPRLAPYCPNPTQQLDFRRFTSDAFLELLLMEKEILMGHTPDIPVTTNFVSHFKHLDYHRWSRELDFTAWDSYPDPLDEYAGRQRHASGNDMMRSLIPGRPFVLMEQTPSAINGRETNLPKRPGLMRLWSLATIARGGDGVMYFQWRASRAGTEKFHGAVIQHVGADRSRVFKEVCDLGDDLKKLSAVSDSCIKAEAGILFDWHNWWSLEQDSKPGKIDYLDTCRRFHDWLYRKNIPVDYLSPESDFTKYKLVILPALYMINESTATALEEFVRDGGTVLVSYFSGIVDGNEHVYLGGYPGPLKDLLGMWVEEWRPYAPGENNRMLVCGSGNGYSCEHWAEVIHLDGASPLASFEKEYFAGNPAFTENEFGRGHAFYLGTRPMADGFEWVMNKVCCERAGLAPVLVAPAEVEIIIRESDTERFLFVLNHSDASVEVDLKGISGTDLLSGVVHQGVLELGPLAVTVLQF